MKGITANQEMDYSVSALVEAYADRQFALCETCFWGATILNSTQKNIHIIKLFFRINDCSNLINILSIKATRYDIKILEIRRPYTPKVYEIQLRVLCLYIGSSIL